MNISFCWFATPHLENFFGACIKWVTFAPRTKSQPLLFDTKLRASLLPVGVACMRHPNMTKPCLFVVFILLSLALHASIVVGDGSFPARTNAATMAPIAASSTCGLNTPSDFCVVALVPNGVSSSLRCTTSSACANTSCPYGATLPLATSVTAGAVPVGNVSHGAILSLHYFSYYS